MKFSFTATIYKVGINQCVEVPLHITSGMTASKGYIPVKGTIEAYPFIQTLVPVKNKAYRLYVNGLMLNGATVKPGDTVTFTIEQNSEPPEFLIPPALRKQLIKNGLLQAFNTLTPYRQKEILRYLGFLKTDDALKRNIEKVITALKEKK
ncbi:DUF1905 domain-containing protein [Ferruginibacter sp. SUN106]|uniref:DUF1905 domain-containing protein n=1 Tax=Ferruginibacter sp. SUN106 TaxID=2978348 RepID=UPI003D36EC68